MLQKLRRGMPFEQALDQQLVGLADDDRRLTHELVAGVLRHGDRLDARLGPLLRRGVAATHPGVLDILRLGAYQLTELDRIPAHAAVATAVELTRDQVGERHTALVNAVLRRLSRERNQAGTAEFSDLATAYSHPRWLVDRWLARFGHDDTVALLEWNNSHPPLVIQSRDGDTDRLTGWLARHDVASFPAPHGAGVVLDSTRPDALPGFASGEWFVQDPAQALVVRFAALAPDAVVYDACAAPGGKTVALAARVRRVVAGERIRRRIARLRANIARLRHTNVDLIQADASQPPIGQVDAVLLDAPCLGTGTFARHPDARLRVDRQALATLVERQAALLDAVADRVAPGGVLCYATCSLEPEENAEQIDRFLARHPEFERRASADETLPMNATGDLEILPQRDGMDGAFAARLIRRGGRAA